MKNTLHFTFFRTLLVVAFGLFFNGAWGQYSGSGVFNKITDSEQFTSGYYILAGNNATTPANRGIMLNTNGSGFINRTAVSTLGASITDASVQNVFLINIDSNGDFTIYNETSGQYASYSGSGNSALLKDGPVTDSERWNLVITTDGLFRFLNKQFSNRFLQYNSGSPRFACYQSSSNQQNLTLYKLPATSTTWNGTAWSNGTPTPSLDAIIAGDYSTGAVAPQGPFTAKSLAVNSGIFTVATGTSVTVENGVTSAGAANFIVKSGANLIQNSSVANTGAITVERESAPIVRLDHTLWSSPVASQNLYTFSPNTLTNRFYVYNTPTDTYVTTGLSAASTFIPGKGFGVRAPNNHPTTAVQWLGTFKGIPNNGEVTFTLTTAGQGFNLVGNPYPSVVDGAAFVAANSTKIEGTLYFYAHTLTMNAQGAFPAGTNYALWNATGQTAATTGTSGVPALVPNGKIQVGQGFLVKSSASGDVVFNNVMREANTANQFFRLAPVAQSTSEVEKHRLWLNLTNAEGTTFNQILIGYVAGATHEIDNLYDGLSFGNEGSALSSRVSNEDYTIQGRALPFDAADVVPLGFKAMTPGNYTISLSNRDGVFAADQNVFLKDNADGSINNIKIAPYTFTAQAGTFNDRFEVVYQNQLSMPETTFSANSVVAFKRGNVLLVQSKNNEMASIKAFDVQGRLVYSKSNINATEAELSDLNVQNGVLLLQVTSVGGVTATIKVIN